MSTANISSLIPTPVGFFDAMTTALETYPETNVEIGIEEVKFPDEVLNVNETGTFIVRVTNNGPLNLTDVTVKISGLNGTLVKSGSAVMEFTDEFENPISDVAGDGGSEVTAAMAFKAPPDKHADSKEDLIKVTLHDWNANLDRILKNHSDPLDTVKDTFSAKVHPS